MSYRFDIPGEPVAKGSRTTGVRKNGTRFTRESSRRVDPWMQAAERVLWTQARNQGLRQPLTGPFDVFISVYFEQPDRPSHPWPSRSDIDKTARATLDALVRGRVISDDRHVTRLTVEKAYATEPRVLITLMCPDPHVLEALDRVKAAA